MSDYKFMLPWPPSINGYWRAFRNRQIISKRGRDYRALAIKYMQSYQLDNKALSGRLQVRITLEPPTLRKYDIDNFCKAVFDALTHAGFWIDDEQIDRLVIEKAPKRKGGNVTVEVSVM